MELYSGEINTVEFEAPNNDVNVSADYTYNNVSVTTTVPTKSTESRIWILELPYLPDEGIVKINWKFTLGGTEYTKSDIYNVVTPYLSTRWIRNNLMEGSTDEQIREAEASARYIINAHTGQSFGREKSTKVAYGLGGNSLALPARAISIDTVNGVAMPSSYTITGDGWYLKHNAFGVPPLRADYYGVHEVNGVIENPYGIHYNQFLKSAKFEIAGIWGWDSIPDAITEATKLLVNDYASGDSMYRDRYLVSMTAADWRLQFTNGAFARTGNVRADQLLSDYVLQRGWAVL